MKSFEFLVTPESYKKMLEVCDDISTVNCATIQVDIVCDKTPKDYRATRKHYVPMVAKNDFENIVAKDISIGYFNDFKKGVMDLMDKTENPKVRAELEEFIETKKKEMFKSLIPEIDQ